MNRATFIKGWGLLSRAATVTVDSEHPRPGHNSDKDAIKRVFVSLYLREMAAETAGLMAAEAPFQVALTAPVLPAAQAVFLSLALGPAGTIAAVGYAAYAVYKIANTIGPETQSGLLGAAERFIAEGPPVSGAVDRWMDKHIDDIVTYIDKAENRDGDLRRFARARGKAEAYLSGAERELLERYNAHNPRSREHNPLLKNYQALLGQWHGTKLHNAIRRDISHMAGPRAAILRRSLTFWRSPA